MPISETSQDKTFKDKTFLSVTLPSNGELDLLLASYYSPPKSSKYFPNIISKRSHSKCFWIWTLNTEKSMKVAIVLKTLCGLISNICCFVVKNLFLRKKLNTGHYLTLLLLNWEIFLSNFFFLCFISGHKTKVSVK